MAATREDLISDTRAWRGAAARRTATDLTAISASVALFHLAFPGGPAPWAGWVSLVPLCLVLHKRSARDAFTLAFATAFFAWWVSTWWTVPALSLASNADPRLLWPMLAALCGFNALPYALTGLLYARCGWTASGTGALKTALVATVICSLAPSILPGTLAHSQYRESTVIQVVDIAGAAGLFFLMHWFNLSLVAAIVLRSTHPARAMRTLAVAVAVLGGTVLYGHLRVADVERRSSALATARIDVGLVQPNLSVQWRHRAHREAAFERLSRLTDRLIDGPAKPQLVIWPEIPVPLSYVKYPEDRAALDALARSVDVPLMVGGFAPDPQRPGSYYNAVHLLSPHAAVQTYHKQRLLPFGEYLPGEDLFPFLRDLFPHALRYHPGSTDVVLTTPSGVRVVPLICYEVAFPDLAAAGVRAGGQLIINTTNDAWLGTGRGAEVHLALAQFRAVESRVPLVRVTNSGISTVIDATGSVGAAGRSGSFRMETLH